MGHCGCLWTSYGASGWRLRSSSEGLDLDDLGVDVAMWIFAGAIHLLLAGDKLVEYLISENEALAEIDRYPELEVPAGDYGGAYDRERREP